ncbi:hypothetical protein RHMOL_Rhmol06G0233300 [Rhododendron molle]|uniref:Uncharacterized protein n=1 Tax=Rhododendron molle TaxID=49168 RepID=A0ACC0NFC7_RHOML|nr:hypothetical protein RHMOL_Rhmol06G0233300 [Rhododendron molle]
MPPLFHSFLKDICPFTISYLSPSTLSIIFGDVLVARLCSRGYNLALFSPFDVVSILSDLSPVPSFHLQPSR